MSFPEWLLLFLIGSASVCIYEFAKGFVQGLRAGRKRRHTEAGTTGGVREMSYRLARADRNHRRQLVEARRRRNLTQADIAQRLGVTPEWVNRIERYDSDPRMSDMRRYQCAIYATE